MFVPYFWSDVCSLLTPTPTNQAIAPKIYWIQVNDHWLNLKLTSYLTYSSKGDGLPPAAALGIFNWLSVLIFNSFILQSYLKAHMVEDHCEARQVPGQEVCGQVQSGQEHEESLMIRFQ